MRHTRRPSFPLIALLFVTACGVSFNSSTTPPPTSCGNGLAGNTARCSGSTLETCVISGNSASQSSSVCLGNTPACVLKTTTAGTTGACCPAGVTDAEDPSCHR